MFYDYYTAPVTLLWKLTIEIAKGEEWGVPRPSISLELLEVLFEASRRNRPSATPDTDILVLIKAFDYLGYTDPRPRSPVAHRCRHGPPCAVIHTFSKRFMAMKILNLFPELFNGMILHYPVRCGSSELFRMRVCLFQIQPSDWRATIFFFFSFSTTDHN